MKNFNKTVGVDRAIGGTVGVDRAIGGTVGVDRAIDGTPITQKAFRGNVDLSKYDDRIDPDMPCVNTGPNKNWVSSMPCSKTNEEIDRQHRYNQMMSKTGTYGMNYIFS